ncbi:MAG: TonB family protein [Candidatus Binatia bacterium]
MAGSTTTSGVKPNKPEALNTGPEERLPKWVLVSLIAHVILIILLVSMSFWPSSKREPPPSYVVDLVGGERIGGRNLGTKLVPESKAKPPPAEPVRQVKSAPPPAPAEPIEKKQRKAEKPPKPDKAEKIKPKPTEAVSLDKHKVKTKQEKTKVAEKASSEAQESATSYEDSLDKVRERVIQAAMERARSRAAAVQASPNAISDTEGERGKPLSAGSGEGLGAESLGKGGVGGEGALKTVEYIRYINYMQATLKGNWAWAGPKRSLKALVRFSVKENGEIVGIKIVQSSGDSLYDESVVRAIRKSSPLTAPPENHRKDFADVEYSFQPDQVG